MTPLEEYVFPVLERIADTRGRVGQAQMSGTDPAALKEARRHGLVRSDAVRGWYLTPTGRAKLERIRVNA